MIRHFFNFHAPAGADIVLIDDPKPS